MKTVLLAILASLILLGCGDIPEQPPAAPAATADATTPASAANNEVLTVAVGYLQRVPYERKSVAVTNAEGDPVENIELQYTMEARGGGENDYWIARDLAPGVYTATVDYPQHWSMLQTVTVYVMGNTPGTNICGFQLIPKPDDAEHALNGALQVTVQCLTPDEISSEHSFMVTHLDQAGRAATTVVARTGPDQTTLTLIEMEPGETSYWWEENLAAGTYTVNAVHPEYGEGTAEFTVRAGMVTVCHLYLQPQQDGE